MELKLRHELAVAQYLIEHLRGTGRDQLSNPRNSAPGNPDVVCDAPDGLRGIEIADGYMAGDDAEQLWTMSREDDQARAGGRFIVSSSGISPLIREPDASLAQSLQRTLEKHCRSRFAMRTYLVLNASHAPLASAEDAPYFLARLRMPSGCPFAAVFLCLTVNFSWRREFFEVPGPVSG